MPVNSLPKITFSAAIMLLSALPLSAQSTGWKPAEQIKTYAVSGNTGLSLIHI